MPNEQDKFLEDLMPKGENPLTDIINPQGEEKKEEVVEETETEKSNRRERRLQAKLTAERESSIALAARLAALTEAQKFRSESEPSSFEEKARRIYGTETPEATAATQLLIDSLREAKEAAKREALEAMREEQEKNREAIQKEERQLDSMVEEIEDEYGVTLDPQSKKLFFQTLERLSPKDSNGDVVAYADHHAVWEELQSRKPQQPNRAKEIAARSMNKTGSSPSTTVQDDATERYLRENGII